MKLINWIKNILKSKQKEQKLYLLKNGFEINDGTNISNIKWDEIEKIDAFKRDLITEDQICLEINVNNKQFYCSQDFDGWIEFEKELQIQLTELDKNWFSKVSQPPFEESRVTIFPKSEYNQKENKK